MNKQGIYSYNSLVALTARNSFWLTQRIYGYASIAKKQFRTRDHRRNLAIKLDTMFIGTVRGRVV
jgi:hypothetical protein